MNNNLIVLLGDARSSKNSMQPFKVKYKEPREIKTGKRKGEFRTEGTIWTKSNNARQQEQEYILQLKDALNKKKWLEMTGNLAYPFYIAFKFYRGSHRRFDYLNACANVSDCLVKAGYIEDDDSDHLVPIFVPYAYDKQNPRIEFGIIDNTDYSETYRKISTAQTELFL